MERNVSRARTTGWGSLRLRLILLLLLAIVTAVAVAVTRGMPSGAPSQVELEQRDDGTSVRIAHGGTIVVALASNPSTGYAWVVSERTEGVELIGAPQYVPPGSTGPVVGAPGTEVLRFQAVARGTYDLVLEYRRSFEPQAAPERSFRVTVEID